MEQDLGFEAEKGAAMQHALDVARNLRR